MTTEEELVARAVKARRDYEATIEGLDEHITAAGDLTPMTPEVQAAHATLREAVERLESEAGIAWDADSKTWLPI